LKAAERYDPAFGVLFRTYASATAYGELRRHYRGTWRLRVARGMQELHLDVIGAIDHLTAQRGASPTLQEVAVYLGREYEDVLDAYVAGANHQPLTIDNVHREDGGDGRESPYLSRTDPGFDDVLDRYETDRLVATLPARLQEIVRLRFEEQLSQSEIAARVGASQVHISRLLRDAIERMRTAARSSDVEAPWGDAAG
jgi:RNA polymerase sigma-B factor